MALHVEKDVGKFSSRVPKVRTFKFLDALFGPLVDLVLRLTLIQQP